MAKKSKNKEAGEQLDLIDVAPENSKVIIAVAKRYKKAQRERIRALDEEKKQKIKLLALVGEAHLQRLEDGKIRFRCDGYLITITPRDELVQVAESDE